MSMLPVVCEATTRLEYVNHAGGDAGSAPQEAQTQNELDPRWGVVDLTRQLCNIPSESGNEGPIADAIAALLHSQAPHLTVTRDGDTIVARTELGREKRVIIAGHLDTVPINHNVPCHEAPDPATGEMMLWGRGSVDMKAGVAVQLSLAVRLTDPVFDVTWVWYDHEEVSASLSGLGRTMQHFPELFAADVAILGEPSAGTIEGGCNGTMRARVSYLGVRAHSARSWMGRNAIHRAGAALERLETYTAEVRDVDGLSYREGLNAVRIEGGVSGNVVPDRCDIEVNFRFAPDRDLAVAEQRMREFFHDADELHIVDAAAGARPGLHDPLVQSLIATAGREPSAKLGWTDVSRFAALGMPAVNFGPGDALLAHADDERVLPAAIVENERALEWWLTGRTA